MSKYYFPKGSMVIQGQLGNAPGGWVKWFKNGRGRGRLLAAGPGVTDSAKFAHETYHDFDQRNQLGPKLVELSEQMISTLLQAVRFAHEKGLWVASWGDDGVTLEDAAEFLVELKK